MLAPAPRRAHASAAVDPIALTLLSSATVAAVVGYVAKFVFERGVIKWRDDLDLWRKDAEVRTGQYQRATDASFASIDKRLENGIGSFSHLKELHEHLAERVKELEQRERERDRGERRRGG